MNRAVAVVPLRQLLVRDIPECKACMIPDSSRSSSPELTDGQISIALDRDLLSLLDGYTQGASRTSTTVSRDLPVSWSASPVSHSRRAPIVGSQFADRKVSSDSMSSIAPDQSRLRGPMTDRRNLIDRGASRGHASESAIHNVSSVRNGILTSSGDVRRIPFTSPRNSSVSASLSCQRSRDSSSSLFVDPLPQVLHVLDNELDDSIVVVRRITRLGFKSNKILKARFEQLGWEIKTVVLLPSRSRPADTSDIATPHARPSSMGFVVFKTRAAASDCISRGSLDVNGVEILLQPFVRQYKPSAIHASS